MINYGAPIKKQKFTRTVKPKSVLRKKNKLSPEENDFIESEWHIREHGLWVIIKEIPIYITGPYYVFLNENRLPGGIWPEFRYVQCQVFILWNAVVRDPNKYGMIIFKPRRVGLTAITNFLLWEKVSRTRGIQAGMQSKSEVSAENNYKKIVKINKRMIWYFKPISRGSTIASGGLDFSYPETMITKKTVEQDTNDGDLDYAYEELSSTISYASSVSTAYDGETLARYTLNEFGKIEQKAKMDPIKCWEVVRPCMEADMGKKITGKAIFESSVEEIAEGEEGTLVICRTLWDEANPNDLDANGRTLNGLIRSFIGYQNSSSFDEWGFSNAEESLRFMENMIDALRKHNKIRQIAAIRRKQPRDIEDALTPGGDKSAFNAEKLSEALERITYAESIEKPFTRRCNLQWKNNVRDTEVEIVYVHDGRWEISQDVPNRFKKNHFEVYGDGLYNLRAPGNNAYFRMGLDPYGQSDSPHEQRSDGAFAVDILFDSQIDKDITYDLEGVAEDGGANMMTNQCVIDYVFRPQNIELFYEDALMTAFYFGCKLLYENNKSAIRQYFINRGYSLYLMDRPKATRTAYSANQKEPGAPATEETINQYFETLAVYIERYYNCLKHKRVVLDLLKMNKSNRKFRDLGVAYGWTKIASWGNYMIERHADVKAELNPIFKMYEIDEIM
jgi:hypothetical protein